jgi:protein-S-isoprenylcysteine O-methyltransferase Ste14
MKEIVWLTGALLGFAIVHSLPATGACKRWAVRAWGAKWAATWYRFTYSLVSVASTAAVAAAVWTVPDVTIFSLPAWLKTVLTILQGASLLFAAAGFRVFRAGEFLGLTQVRRHLRGENASGDAEGIRELPLQRRGVYGMVRHPMYSGAIAIFLLSPTFTRTWLVVRIFAVIYFVVGALIEERHLLSLYGDRYRQYMNEVPRFIPRLRTSRLS